MPQINPHYNPNPTPSARVSPNASVPVGHRAKCRTCGAVDNVAYKGGDRRKARCGACGSTIARRRAPRAPKVISFAVVRQLNGESYGVRGYLNCVDLFMAEREALSFVERGPVARSRVAAVIELLDGNRTGNVRVLRYDNFRQRRSSLVWEGGCETCKGKGLIGVRVPAASPEDRSTVRYSACVSCSGLGGELTRMIMFGRELRGDKR
jgi:hypothetical protein